MRDGTLSCEEVLNVCELAALRKQTTGFFHFCKARCTVGFVPGHEAPGAGTPRAAG